VVLNPAGRWWLNPEEVVWNLFKALASARPVRRGPEPCGAEEERQIPKIGIWDGLTQLIENTLVKGEMKTLDRFSISPP
jgi:hypothetical protein